MTSTLIDDTVAAYESLQGRYAELSELLEAADESGYVQEYQDADDLRGELDAQARDLLDTLVAAIKADRLRHDVLEVHLCGECDDAAVED